MESIKFHAPTIFISSKYSHFEVDEEFINVYESIVNNQEKGYVHNLLKPLCYMIRRSLNYIRKVVSQEERFTIADVYDLNEVKYSDYIITL